MTPRKTKDLVCYLEDRERGEILGQLLKKHPDLRGEANIIAKNLLDDVSVEVISKDVAKRVLDIPIEVEQRCGKWVKVLQRSVDEAKLVEKLRLVEALFAGASTAGEKVAAESAKQRILDRPS